MKFDVPVTLNFMVTDLLDCNRVLRSIFTNVSEEPSVSIFTLQDGEDGGSSFVREVGNSVTYYAISHS
jgi:hypothetical protein